VKWTQRSLPKINGRTHAFWAYLILKGHSTHLGDQGYTIAVHGSSVGKFCFHFNKKSIKHF